MIKYEAAVIGKLVPELLCPSHIPLGLSWARTRGQNVTAIARPQSYAHQINTQQEGRVLLNVPYPKHLLKMFCKSHRTIRTRM